MTEDDMSNAITMCRQRIKSFWPGAEITKNGRAQEHALWMLREIEEFYKGNNHDKAMRWLGFVQGWLWGANLATIVEMRYWNKPDREGAP